jgi:hypothetical protein
LAVRRRGPTVEWKVSIPQNLALDIELLFYDPVNHKPDYGARSALITQLLSNYWASLPEERKLKARTFQGTTPP